MVLSKTCTSDKKSAFRKPIKVISFVKWFNNLDESEAQFLMSCDCDTIIASYANDNDLTRKEATYGRVSKTNKIIKLSLLFVIAIIMLTSSNNEIQQIKTPDPVPAPIFSTNSLNDTATLLNVNSTFLSVNEYTENLSNWTINTTNSFQNNSLNLNTTWLNQNSVNTNYFADTIDKAGIEGSGETAVIQHNVNLYPDLYLNTTMYMFITWGGYTGTYLVNTSPPMNNNPTGFRH